MSFDLSKAITVIERTPAVLLSLLDGLDAYWTESGHNVDDWQPFDVVGHLIHAEKTDWIPRARIILARDGDRQFVPFDRLAQFESSNGKELGPLLDEFRQARAESLSTLSSWRLAADDLELTGLHPELGEVTLGQLLATWVVHDLTHIRQICVKMAGRYTEAVGPWREYLSILK